MEMENVQQKVNPEGNLNQDMRPSNPISNQKGNFLLIIGIVVLLLVIGAGGYFLYQKQVNKPAATQVYYPTPSPTSDETANWKTYTNQEIGISFKYPPAWESLDEKEELCLPIDGLTREYQNQPCVLISLSSQIDKFVFFAAQSKLFVKYAPGRGGYWGDRSSIGTNLNETTLEEFIKTYCKEYSNYECNQQTNNNGVYYIKSLEDEQVMLSKRKAHYYFVINKNNNFPALFLSDQDLLDKMSLEEAEKIFDQILSTFKFLDQSSTNVIDESSVKDLVLNFYKAFEKEDGNTLFKFMTPPVTSQEKGEYSWLTGADLGANAFYRAFLRVKLANFSIKNVKLVDDKTFEVTATDELQGYSQVTTKWSEPTLRNVKFTVIKTPASWLIDKFTYTGTVTWTYKGTEKYNGFPNLETN